MAGVIDWHLKTVGEIQEALIDNHNIYFQSIDNLYGQISNQDGKVVNSYGREINQKSQQLIWNKAIQQQQYQEMAFYQNNNDSLLIYNFSRDTYQEIVNSIVDGQILDYLFLSQQQILIMTENGVYLLNQQQEQSNMQEIKTAQANEKFLALSQNGSDIFIISQEAKKLKIEKNQIQGSLMKQSEQVHNITGQFDKTNLFVSKEYVLYSNNNDSYLFSLSSLKNIELPGKQQFKLDRQNNFVIEYQQNGSIQQIYSIQQENLVPYYKSTNQDNQIIIVSYTNANNQQKPSLLLIELNQSTNLAKLLNIQSLNNQSILISWVQTSKIQKAWFKGNDYHQYLLIQSQDLQTVLYDVKQQQTNDGLIWSNEESLAYIQEVKFIDFTHSTDRHVSAYHELLDEKGTCNTVYLLPSFIMRITGEFTDTISSFFGSFSYVQEVLQELLLARSVDDIQQLNRKNSKSSDEYNIFYGLKKIILFVTKQNTILRYESDNGDLVWRQNFQHLLKEDSEFLGIFDLQERHQDLIQNEVILVFYSLASQELQILRVNVTNGDIIVQQTHKLAQKPLKLMELQKEHSEYLVVLNEDFTTITYPEFNGSLLKESNKEIIYYMFDKQKNQIKGFSFINDKIELIWNMNFSDQEEVIQIDSSYNQASSPKIAIFDDTKVFFKHIDYTNFAVITKSQGKGIYQGQGILNLYIVNAKTGRILFNHNQQIVDLSLPINMTYDENGVYVTYFNPEQYVYEIWVVEAYSKDMVTSFINMIEDFYISPKDQQDINLVEDNLNIIFLEQKYGFPLGIKAFSVVETKLSLTKRNLAIITQNNQIYSLDRALISPRRSTKDKAQLAKSYERYITFDSTDLPQYAYMIPVQHVKTLSYNIKLNGLQNIKFAPSNFESTSLMIAYGGDIFFNQVAPEKKFDILSSNFNYIFLIITSIAVVVMSIIVKKLAKNSLIYKLFHK